MCSPATTTCEHESVDLVPDATTVDGCAPVAELCGDGVDQDCNGDDPACVANDGPAGAIDVTDGGTFTANLQYAHDDVGAEDCGGDAGRDLYYSVSLGAPRVYYFDTFGSSFNSVIRVYAMPCSAVASGAVAQVCGDDSCSTPQSQVATSLPAGESCIVVDQASDAETSGEVSLKVVAGSRDGSPLPSGTSSLTGDTSGSTNIMDPSDTGCDGPGSGGKDLAYFFTLCPGQTLTLDAETCTGATWDTVLYVRRGNTTQIGCNDDACGNLQTRITDVAISDGELFWLVIDGWDASDSGAYTLQTNLR